MYLLEVLLFISPDGNDNNIEKQYQYYGMDNQRTYSLYSINAAIQLMHKFRAGKRISFTIRMSAGTYTYDTRQVLAHPDTTCNFYLTGEGTTIIKSDQNLDNKMLILCTRGY